MPFLPSDRWSKTPPPWCSSPTARWPDALVSNLLWAVVQAILSGLAVASGSGAAILVGGPWEKPPSTLKRQLRAD